MRVVLLGPPGSGKGTQAHKLSIRLGVPSISTGEIFRNGVAERSPLGLKAQRYLDAGELVPSDLTNALIDARLGQSDVRGGFILDGFPRSLNQAVALHSMLEARGAHLDAVLEFAVDEDELLARLVERGRADDTEDVIRNRMRLYRVETTPLLKYYSNDLTTVEATGTLDTVFARALHALGQTA